MSRNTVILLVVLCAAIAGLIVVSKMRPGRDLATAASEPQVSANTGAAQAQAPNKNNSTFVPTARNMTTNRNPLAITPGNGEAQLTTVPRARSGVTNPAMLVPPNVVVETDTNLVPETKPLPVLEKDYATATNRDVRLDVMMDIAEIPGAESVRALTRLFQAETDTDLKVDLLDSLLGIEGFKEEKLIMLTMGARQGLPSEVRQSAIDGLIDLDDPRAIPVLNGMLNDPDEEIRESAKDALEMIQSQPVVLKK